MTEQTFVVRVETALPPDRASLAIVARLADWNAMKTLSVAHWPTVEDLLADKTDQELSDEYEEAVRWRDWGTCDDLSDELERRQRDREAQGGA